jgi:hypothetical protein
MLMDFPYTLGNGPGKVAFAEAGILSLAPLIPLIPSWMRGRRGMSVKSEIELDNDRVMDITVGVARFKRSQPFLEDVNKGIECPTAQQRLRTIRLLPSRLGKFNGLFLHVSADGPDAVNGPVSDDIGVVREDQRTFVLAQKDVKSQPIYIQGAPPLNVFVTFLLSTNPDGQMVTLTVIDSPNAP